MARYNDSYRMIHFNTADMPDAITTLDVKTFEEVKNIKVPFISFHGNGAVKTINVHDDYDTYKLIANKSRKRRLLAIKETIK